MKPNGRIEFLERDSYRQRRLRDGARLVPLFGAVFMFVPLMWPREQSDQSLTSSGILYLFGLWLILVIAAFVLSRFVTLDDPDGGADQGASRGAGRDP